MRHQVVRDYVCVSKAYLHQSTQGQIKSLHVSTLAPYSPLLKQTSILKMLCIFELGNLFSSGSDFKCFSLLHFNGHVYDS